MQLRGFEYVKGVILDPIPFDLERDLVTATMKKKRKNMLKYYKVILVSLTVSNYLFGSLLATEIPCC
jgi:long-subunit acyl-CoA synthetase (AMP-forming)